MSDQPPGMPPGTPPSDEPQPNTPPSPPPGQATGPEVTPLTQDARNMAMLAHLLGIVLGPIGPLIIWLIKKDESPFVDDQGKEALNFQLTFLIVWVAIVIFTIITCGIGGVLAPVALVLLLVFCILAGLAANKGERYRYPINIRFIK